MHNNEVITDPKSIATIVWSSTQQLAQKYLITMFHIGNFYLIALSLHYS